MEKIKSLSKELSVFGLVLVVFLALFVYRQFTYASYKTISTTQLETQISSKKDLILVVGTDSDSTTQGYLETVTKYQTKHRSPQIYYVDLTDQKDNYLEKLLNINVSYPTTLVIKEGKVTAKKTGSLQYYTLVDFIKENN